MHNIKDIRDNPDDFKKKISRRNVKINFDEILKLDKENREKIQIKEKLEQEKKIISKQKDKTQFERSKKISEEIKNLENSQKHISDKINSILHLIPNIPLDDVPIGTDDSSNKVLKTNGFKIKFNGF